VGHEARGQIGFYPYISLTEKESIADFGKVSLRLLYRDALRPHLAWHGAKLSFVATFLVILLRVKTMNFSELPTAFNSKAVEFHDDCN